jgi:hypothetical protein
MAFCKIAYTESQHFVVGRKGIPFWLDWFGDAVSCCSSPHSRFTISSAICFGGAMNALCELTIIG